MDEHVYPLFPIVVNGCWPKKVVLKYCISVYEINFAHTATGPNHTKTNHIFVQQILLVVLVAWNNILVHAVWNYAGLNIFKW